MRPTRTPMRPTAKSLILDLLSTLRRGAMPVRALIAAGELLGIAGNPMRVALARLLAAGLVERDERGRYRLGARAEAVGTQIASWRRIDERLRPWSGGWIGVHTAAVVRGHRRAVKRRSRALRFLGFRELRPGLLVRPDNLAGGTAKVREQLERLGLEPEAPVFALRELDAGLESRARELWDVNALRDEYRSSRRAIEESARKLAGELDGLTPARAMTESFLLGGRVIRQIVFDPLLPEPILPAAERRALVAAMVDYDRKGRAAWAAFLRSFEVENLRTPADLRLLDGEEHALQAAGGAS
ncbi:MAG TPA: PaaX family transcriptional regulator C-terminal domain-containing protein [Candidatus Bathyarchaeia archaeon]|nr:PaaX family transcriptional regulator C-terminal domain-containing protein [Candidatus Bathyarchaeia archaeon]